LALLVTARASFFKLPERPDKARAKTNYDQYQQKSLMLADSITRFHFNVKEEH
jgi:hypothetical protein